MTLRAFGINHTTAPVNFRERVAVSAEMLPDALGTLVQWPGVCEATILSTCNRTDIYCGIDAKRGASEAEGVHRWLARFHGINDDEVERHSYILEEASAVRHVMRVGSGLDSMVLGEPQILGQLKDAYRAGVDNGTVGTVLSKLFQHTFAVAKKVRTDTAVGSSPVSVAFAAVSLARQIFGDLGGSTALLLGAGETVELAARHLASQGLGRLIVANRTVENARRLAVQHNGYAIGLGELEAHLDEADILIASTGASVAIVDAGMAERAIARRKRRPVLMVDIAVPQDIDPAVGTLQDVYLYNIDDLQEVAAEGQRSRAAAAEEAMEIIDAQVDQFMAWLDARAANDSIRALRGQAETHRDMLLEKGLRRLAAGDDPGQVLGQLANALTNKLIHQPTKSIREAAGRKDLELLVAARKLFEFEDDGNPR